MLERVDVIGRKIRIGRIMIGAAPGADKVWLEMNGEGGSFPLDEVERLLIEYYRENF